MSDISLHTTEFRPTLTCAPADSRGGSDFELSLAHGSLRRIDSKEYLFVEGDAVTHLYRIETGAIALYKLLPDGRRQITGFAYPGDIIGLGCDGVHDFNAQAIKATRVRCLLMDTLRHAAGKDPKLALQLYHVLSCELSATRDLMLTTGQRSATERVASFLLAFSRRNARNSQDPAEIELPMTRSDIGDFLGLTIETVSRTFTKLKQMGLIELRQCHHVRLLKLNQLREIAEGL